MIRSSDILIALQMAVMDAEDLPVAILWKAEDAGAFLTLALVTLR